jgi:hypothetical protein
VNLRKDHYRESLSSSNGAVARRTPRARPRRRAKARRRGLGRGGDRRWPLRCSRGTCQRAPTRRRPLLAGGRGRREPQVLNEFAAQTMRGWGACARGSGGASGALAGSRRARPLAQRARADPPLTKPIDLGQRTTRPEGRGARGRELSAVARGPGASAAARPRSLHPARGGAGRAASSAARACGRRVPLDRGALALGRRGTLSQPRTVDHLARGSMKNAAKCASACELQDT